MRNEALAARASSAPHRRSFYNSFGSVEIAVEREQVHIAVGAETHGGHFREMAYEAVVRGDPGVVNGDPFRGIQNGNRSFIMVNSFGLRS